MVFRKETKLTLLRSVDSAAVKFKEVKNFCLHFCQRAPKLKLVPVGRPALWSTAESCSGQCFAK